MQPGDRELLEKIVSKFQFVNQEHSRWFLRAMTHRSFANEENINYDNERLEFLGDAVLDLVVCEFLFREFPAYDEGRLSEVKSAVVNTSTLTRVARELNLGEILRLSKGEAQSNRGRDKVMADSLEALVGALYLTHGLERTRSFVVDHFEAEIRRFLESGTTNYKGMLLEYTQQRDLPDPEYRVQKVEGPEHDPFHTVAVYLRDEQWGVGEGKTKKEAEQQAARQALSRVQSESTADSSSG